VSFHNQILHTKELPKKWGVSKPIKKWQTTDSVCDKKKSSGRNVVTEGKVQDIQAVRNQSSQIVDRHKKLESHWDLH
jgi:hypothetical protein